MNSLVAITRGVGASLSSCDLTFLTRAPIDLAEAIRQHAGYCAALIEAGIALEMLAADQNLPDAVFVEDTAIVLDELAVITRPLSEMRRREVATVNAALKRHRPRVFIQGPGTLEGGDVLRVGRRFFVGLSSRTNQAGYAQFSRIAEHHGYRVAPVRVGGCLHLKSAVTPLDEETLLINPNWTETGQFSGLSQVQVPLTEPFAANCLSINGMVHLSARWVRTRELLEQRGYATKALWITEFEKAEAGLTCLSIIFNSVTIR
jgi:dimethylargininase